MTRENRSQTAHTRVKAEMKISNAGFQRQLKLARVRADGRMRRRGRNPLDVSPDEIPINSLKRSQQSGGAITAIGYRKRDSNFGV